MNSHPQLLSADSNLPASPSVLELKAAREKQGPAVLMLFRRHRLALMGITLLGFAAGVMVSLISTPLYRATAVLEVQGVNPEFLGAKDLDPASNVQTVESYTATAAKLLQGNALAERVVATTDLTHRAEFFSKSSAYVWIRRRLGLKPDNLQPSTRDAAATLKDRLRVRADGTSNLLLVSMDAPEPRLAAELTQALASEFQQQEQEARWNSAARVNSWLAAQLEELRRNMETSGAQLQTYANTANLHFGQDGSNVADHKLDQLQQELSRAQADRINKEAQLQLVKTSPIESLPLVLDSAPIREYKLRLADLRKVLADLNTMFTPEHYRVKSTLAQIAEIETALNRERNSLVTRIQNDYNASLAREALLETTFARQVGVVADTASRSVRYDTLKRQAESDQTLYRTVLGKVKETSMLSAIRTNTVRVVDPPQAPERPHSPSYVANAGLGALCGMMLSGLLVLLRERLDATIREPGEIFSTTRVRELGAIPSNRMDHPPAIASLSSARRILGPLTAAPAAGPASVFSEAFRCVAVSLLSSSYDQRKLKTYLITSALAGDGKTTTAVNLACALGVGGKRVALIDADLRKPSVHRLMNLSVGAGLSDLLAMNRVVGSADILNALTVTPARGVMVLGAGTIPVPDPGWIESPRLRDIMAHLRREFDIVIVDCPPALQIPDARLLARVCDAVILVGRGGHTKVKDLYRAARLLVEDGRLVAGSVLTDWDPRFENPGYFSSYYRRYA